MTGFLQAQPRPPGLVTTIAPVASDHFEVVDRQLHLAELNVEQLAGRKDGDFRNILV